MLGELGAAADAQPAGSSPPPLSPGRGLVPRVFEHLFTRMALDEKRDREATGRDVKYVCKVSFLEVCVCV